MNIIDKVMQRDENLLAGEAHYLWQHLLGRYDSQELLQFYTQYINDEDLRTVASTGSNVIQRQIKTLEDISSKHEIPLPAKPPKPHRASAGSEDIRDEIIFRDILIRSQVDLELHVSAIKATLSNSLWKIFKNLIKEDLDNYENLINFGKSKGWLSYMPQYKN